MRTRRTPPSWSKLTPQGVALYKYRADVLALLTEFGATNPAVFGSVSRGTSTEESDVDILVDLPVSCIDSTQLHILEGKLQDLLGFDVDVVPVALLTESVLRQVRRDLRQL
jgi:predicted nucleotidyltransferase